MWFIFSLTVNNWNISKRLVDILCCIHKLDEIMKLKQQK